MNTKDYTRQSFSSLETTLAEYVTSVSSNLGADKFKDMHEIYVISALKGYKLNNIVKKANLSGKEIGSFTEILHNWRELELEYNTFDDIVNKPDFYTLYNKVIYFLYPFIIKEYNRYEYKWDGQKWQLA